MADLQRCSSQTAERVEQVRDTLTDLNLRVEDISQGLDDLIRPDLPAPVAVVNKLPAINTAKSRGGRFSLRRLWSS